jgi:hypothetical protein
MDSSGKDGRDKAVEILKKYGAAGFAGVKPEHWASFHADCVAELKRHTAPAATGAAGLL